MFPTRYSDILHLLDQIDPVAYGKTRNYADGSVTRLSPYISRGVISTRQVLESVVRRGYKIPQIESFVKELCWRDYFQRIGQTCTDELVSDNGRSQANVDHYLLPAALQMAETGIDAIDDCIRSLYDTGYMHNHMRMYVAALATNIGHAHWQMPAKWMYFHLLDADFASNHASWQWVCGVRSHKKYIANQENINKYFYSTQRGSFLDFPYETLEDLPVPKVLTETTRFEDKTELPETGNPNIDPSRPIMVYTIYQLDPAWAAELPANRILLLEPGHFAQFPVCARTLAFALELAKSIPGIQVFTGAFNTLKELSGGTEIQFREHPLTRHFSGTESPRKWIVPEVDGYFPSFSAYWKKISPLIYRRYAAK
jgi:deoxyribodipyrimidine photo-lyase